MSDSANAAKTAHELGQQAFERGRYADAVSAFEQALKHERPISLDGDIKLWLVNALAAADRRDEAVELCTTLALHPDFGVRKESKRVLYIIQAPKLEAREEWLTKIPDLGNLDGSEGKNPWQTKTKTKPPRPKPQPEPLPLSDVNTEDNGFVWLALIGCGLIMGGLWWFS